MEILLTILIGLLKHLGYIVALVLLINFVMFIVWAIEKIKRGYR